MSLSLITGLGDDLWFTQGYSFLAPVGGDHVILQGYMDGSNIILQGYVATLAPSDNVDGPVQEVVRISTSASAVADVSYLTATDLGRRRLGDRVSLSISIDGVPPDEPPVAHFFDESGNLLWEKELPTGDGREFAREFLVAQLPVSKINVRVSYRVFGVQSQELFAFTVLPGDSGGDVQGLHVNSRPESQYVLAQLTNGTIVQGRQPRL